MSVKIITGDARAVLKTLPDESVHCVVTSPPYWGLRDYGVAGQIGLEETPDAFVVEMAAIFRDVRRVLRADGTAWVNLGDSYATQPGKGGNVPQTKHPNNSYPASAPHRSKMFDALKPKDLVGIPWRVAFALQADGWWLRQDIIWSKPNPMPESVADRCTKAHEYLFLLAKSERYYYDAEAIKEPFQTDPKENYPARAGILGRGNHASSRAPIGSPRRDNTGGYAPNGDGRNKRSVWEIATQPFSEAHFATFPPALIEPCILAGCPKGGTVLDPFGGAGTTGLVADRLGRNAILIELNPEYAAMAERRIRGDSPLFAEVSA